MGTCGMGTLMTHDKVPRFIERGLSVVMNVPPGYGVYSVKLFRY